MCVSTFGIATTADEFSFRATAFNQIAATLRTWFPRAFGRFLGTKLLRGNVNVTLDTIVKVSAALGLVCEVRLVGGKAPAYNQVAKAAFKGPGADRVSDGGRLHA